MTGAMIVHQLGGMDFGVTAIIACTAVRFVITHGGFMGAV